MLVMTSQRKSMDKFTVFEAIENKYDSLSKTHKRIANYLREHFDKAVFMTAKSLARELDTSESTVVRFATSLGYQGYPDFHQHLRNNITSVMTTEQRLTTKSRPDSLEEAIKQSFSRDISDIRKTAENIDMNALKEVAEHIINAKRVFILAKRSSRVLAEYLNVYLNYFHEDVKNFHLQMGDYFDQFINLTKDDVVLVFSFPRYSNLTLEIVDFLKTKGVKVCAFTDAHDSPIVKKADISLFAPYSIDSFIDSYVAPMAVINALISTISHEHLDIAEEKIKELEKIWKTYNVYY